MKKILVTILALIYLVTSTGAAVNIHYCMGKVASVSLSHDKDEACGKCGMKTKGGCCKDEFKSVKIKDSHKQAAVYQSIVPPVLIVHSTENIFQLSVPAQIARVIPNNNSPPGSSSRSLCVLNCIFRI
jgi:hypothetical protein